MNNGRSADLHVHTAFSDGSFSPEEVVRRAIENGLSAIAITDHEEISGIEPALRAAENDSLEIIAGVELSTEVKGSELHILGFYIDWNKSDFLQRLEYVRSLRIRRMRRMVEKLAGKGIDVDIEKVFRLSGPGSVGRLHLAQVLHQEGKVSSPDAAFRKYIGEGRPCYVKRARPGFEEAINLIVKIGGIPVLAHPRVPGIDEIIPSLVKKGLRGIEVYHPGHSEADILRYLRIARKYHLLVTGGSDCHGTYKGDILLGSVKVPYRLVEELKSKHKEYQRPKFKNSD